jgi:nucleoid-associated protein YgaU
MPLKNRSSVPFHPLTGLRPWALAVAGLALLGGSASAQNYPVTASQRATADQVAQTGVALSELAPNAPDSHTVKRGDTLWAISKIFLKSPWRWPELWGMNRDDIKNPHRIYPGQVLYLDKTGGRARLSTRAPGGGIPDVRVSPRVRSESLSDSSIPPVNMQAIESFLAEPLIVDEATFARAARIVAAPENRVLLSLGDRAYARAVFGDGSDTTIEPLSMAPGKPREYRVFRNATALKDPESGDVLGYEAQYVGKAQVVRSEGTRPVLIETSTAAGKPAPVEIVPATIDITRAKEEMRVGDRLLPEPPRDYSNYVPSAPATAQNGQIVSVYGNAVRFASQNQVVSINRGRTHGLQNGHVLALIRDANLQVDATDDSRPMMRLPGERNGLMMVFRTFDKLSYALVLDIEDAVKVGDRFMNP